MKMFVVHLHCRVCDRHHEIPCEIQRRIVDFNADEECCGQWMEHLNKRIECDRTACDCVCRPRACVLGDLL